MPFLRLALCGLALQLAPALAQAQSFADALTPTTARPAGAALDKTALADSPAKWTATKDVQVGAQGATPAAPGGAHVTIPVIAGRFKMQADVSPKGCPFIGLALGRGNLSGNFWQNLGVMVTVSESRYDVFAAGRSLVPKLDPTLLSKSGASHVEVELDTAARTVSVRINGQPAVDALLLPKEAQVDAMTAAGFRFQEPVTALQPWLSNFRVDLESTSVAGLSPVDYGMCYVLPDQPATLHWRAASPGPAQPIPYDVIDYTGQKIGSGLATLEAGGVISLTRTFARGYAEVSFPGAHQTFGVISLEPHAGPADPFFCIDASLTWLETDPLRRDGLVRMMARSGLAMARERFDSVFTSKPGTYQWEGARGMESVRQRYTESGVQVLEIVGRGDKIFGMVAGQRYPQDLPAVAAVWLGVAHHWQPVWGGAEVYNEPDLTTFPADQYAPMAKAFSYCFAAAKSSTPLVTGVAATIPPGPWFETLAANGLLADTDVFSFHSYDRPVDIEAMVVRYREWLKKAGRETLPLWHTECGHSWANGPARPPASQDALSAAEIAAMGIETKACGVARYFPFVLTYYEEGLKNFGMLGREATPLRSLAAYVQSALALSGQPYLGDLVTNDPVVKLARVFGQGEQVVIALYTGVQEPKATVSLPIAPVRISGADGRTLTAIGGRTPVPDGLTYVWVKRADLGVLLKTDTRAAELTKLGRSPLATPRLASPVVLQFLAQQMPAQVSARRYLVTQELARQLPIAVRLHNLSSSPLTVTPELTLPGGAPERKEAVTVPGQSHVDVAWKLDAIKALDIARTSLVTVAAQSSGDVPPSPLAIPLTMEGTLEQHLARHGRQTPLPITDLTKWQANMASGQSHFTATPEGTWRVDLSFAAKQGNWAYPRFQLPAPLDPATQRGLVLRIRTLQPGRPAIIAKSALEGKGVSFWVPEIFPGDGAWHVVYIPFAEFAPGPGGAGNQNTRLDPASWRYLEIGMGSNTPENALEISHLLVVGDAE